jgi:hypothetical protein
MVDSDRSQITIGRIACWLTMATDPHSEYVTLIILPRRQWYYIIRVLPALFFLLLNRVRVLLQVLKQYLL